jgi:hypothetical protein
MKWVTNILIYGMKTNQDGDKDRGKNLQPGGHFQHAGG